MNDENTMEKEMGEILKGTYKTKTEAKRKKADIIRTGKSKGFGKSIKVGGSYSVRIAKRNNKYEVWERV